MVEQEKSALVATGKTRPVASIYNPDLLTKQQLIGSFVVRLKKFKKIFEDIKSSEMTHPEQPLLVVGLRGMGKTTLLLRLSYEVENTASLNKWLVPIVFNEEEYGINRLFKFWEHVALYLEKKEPQFKGLYDDMDNAYALINNDERYEQKAFELLIDALHKSGKKLLLFIDNFGDMFKRFSKHERQRLREVVMTCVDLRIIAGSSVVAEAFYKYDDPFYELFKVERLEGLNKEEAEALLIQLGEHYPVNPAKEVLEKQPHRIETLRRLTGGIPRSIVLLFEIFVDDKEGNAFTDLESILDRVTPLYKHRMDELPPQQQEIVNVIAHAWDAVSAKEVAIKTRLDSKLVSAQLKQLHQSNIIDIQPTNNKNHLYLLHDRFFNIWYLMRMARKGDKNRVLWLIRFLEQWCDEDQLSKRSESLMRAFNKGEYNPKGALYLSTALHYAEKHNLNNRYELSKQTQRYLQSKDASLHEQLSYSDMSFFKKAIDLIKRKEFEAACLELESIKDKNAQDYLLLSALYEHLKKDNEAQKAYQKALDNKAEHPERIIGNIFRDYLNDYTIAEAYYLKAIENGDIKALRQLGWLNENKFKNIENAEGLYRQAIEKGDTVTWFFLAGLYSDEKKEYIKAEEFYLKADEEGHNDALRSLGWLYQTKLKDIEKAEEYYYKAIEKGATLAWCNLAHLYQDEKKDYVKAEEYYLKAIDEGYNDAFRLLGLMYYKKLKNIEKAEELYFQAINKGDTFSWGNLGDLYSEEKQDYIRAEEFYLKANEDGYTHFLRSLGWMYQTKLHNIEKAEELYCQAIQRGDDIEGWKYLGDLYSEEKKNYIKAEECYLKAYENSNDSFLPFLGNFYYHRLNNIDKAEQLYTQAVEKGYKSVYNDFATLYRDEKQDYEKAEKYYLKAIDEGNPNAYLQLAWQYDFLLNEIEKAEKLYLKATEKGETEAWYYLIQIYIYQKKDYNKALEAIEKSSQYDQLPFLAFNLVNKIRDIEKAEIYLNRALEKGVDEHEVNGIRAWAYFVCMTKPKVALDCGLKAYKEYAHKSWAYNLACVQLWNNEIEQAKDLTQGFMYDDVLINDDNYLILFFLFLAKEQYDFIYNYFTSEKGEAIQLKDRFKPIWYATLYYMQDKYPTEYLRMPPEIKETVEEAIAKVEQMRIDYRID
jgi:TPR repeat protein